GHQKAGPPARGSGRGDQAGGVEEEQRLPVDRHRGLVGLPASATGWGFGRRVALEKRSAISRASASSSSACRNAPISSAVYSRRVTSLLVRVAHTRKSRLGLGMR